MSDDFQNVVWQTFRIARRRAFPDIMLERRLRVLTRDNCLLRILVGQFLEREPTAIGDFHRPGQCFRVTGKQPLHLFGRFEESIRMTLPLETDVIDGGSGANTGDDVLQLPARRFVEKNVIRYNGLHLEACGHVRQFMQPHLVVRPPAKGKGEIGPVTEHLRHLSELRRAGLVGQIGHQNTDQALGIDRDVVEM